MGVFARLDKGGSGVQAGLSALPQLPSYMPRKSPLADDDSQPVMVPRNDKGLVAMPLERVRRLREHLIRTLHSLRKSQHLEDVAAAVPPQPAGFAACVAHAACSLCQGFCCRNGDDDGFLDDRTLARVRLTRPDITDQALLRLYLDHVPPVSYQDSCIFHGGRGCTLDRTTRADICNSYFCGGLGAYLRGINQATPTFIIAGEGSGMRTSPVLSP
jgi:hypothetical protein